MSSSQYDFTIEQGSSFTLGLTYNDSNNNPIDITGWCARLVFITDENTQYLFSTTNLDPSLYSFTIDGPLGRIELKIPASVTNDYNFLNAKYDLELQSTSDLYTGGGNIVERLLYGNIFIAKRYSETNDLLQC
jgi:hypothetical protein